MGGGTGSSTLVEAMDKRRQQSTMAMAALGNEPKEALARLSDDWLFNESLMVVNARAVKS